MDIWKAPVREEGRIGGQPSTTIDEEADAAWSLKWEQGEEQVG